MKRLRKQLEFCVSYSGKNIGHEYLDDNGIPQRGGEHPEIMQVREEALG